MRYEIVVDDGAPDNTAPAQSGTPWSAALYPVDDNGYSGDQIGTADGATPAEAVKALLADLQKNPWVHGQTWKSRT